MQIRYLPSPWPEADITATPAEFAVMASRVAELVAAGSGEVVFPATGPGLTAVVVRIDAGLVVVVASNGVLLVSGGPDAIGLFGGNLPVEPSLPVSYHVHFEHAGREWFVAAESVPLIMTVGPAPKAKPVAAAHAGT